MRFDDILSRLTIKDVLSEAGLKPKSSRMTCPIHGGDNPTAFSFREHTFICFACGAKGGMLDLVEYLHRCSRQDAMKYLCRLAGIDREMSGGGGGVARVAIRPFKAPALRHSAGYWEALDRLETLKLRRYGCEERLKFLERRMKGGRCDQHEYYAKRQSLLYQLEELDAKVIESTNKVNLHYGEEFCDACDN